MTMKGYIAKARDISYVNVHPNVFMVAMGKLNAKHRI
jgi:hypothetical protein